MTRLSLLATILALAVLPVAGSERPDFFPQAVGDTHTYKSPFSGWTDTITGQHDGSYVHSDYWGDKVPRALSHTPTGDVVQKLEGQDHLWYRFALDSKAVWTLSVPTIECVDGCQLHLAGVETVKVPAGTFDGCVKIVFSGRCNDAGPRAQWFAPHVGLVKTQNDSISGPRYIVLTSAVVGGHHYP